ncbi:phosphoserine phosphatase isoform X2 [Lycorma delicatula]|uniref:phosphoserine phosphatase isoform X2 n=1 Tax=Lycorma delicatula TaxID=130591 RepID=UPI003F518857
MNLQSIAEKMYLVCKMTKNAMSGALDFKQSLAMRLDIIKPSMSTVRDFIRDRPPRLSPGVKKLIDCLHQRSIPVYLVSGGFRGVIGPIALELNIPLQNIFANKLKFYLNGEYGGFDENEPTSRNGGKAEVMSILKKTHGYCNLVMIGDGITDLEACPPADAFIGYGGNVVREEVRKKCRWYVTDFNELISSL